MQSNVGDPTISNVKRDIKNTQDHIPMSHYMNLDIRTSLVVRDISEPAVGETHELCRSDKNNELPVLYPSKSCIKAWREEIAKARALRQ